MARGTGSEQIWGGTEAKSCFLESAQNEPDFSKGFDEERLRGLLSTGINFVSLMGRYIGLYIWQDHSELALSSSRN